MFARFITNSLLFIIQGGRFLTVLNGCDARMLFKYAIERIDRRKPDAGANFLNG
jgi:hypothetical protein